MSKAVTLSSQDRFINLGVAIGMLRRMKGYSQEEFAEKAKISRGLLSKIETPNIAKVFSLQVFFDIADALEIDPVELLRYSQFPDMLKDK